MEFGIQKRIDRVGLDHADDGETSQKINPNFPLLHVGSGDVYERSIIALVHHSSGTAAPLIRVSSRFLGVTARG